MSKKRSNSTTKKPRKKKNRSRSTGSIYRRIFEQGKTVKLTSSFARRAKQLKKTNYKKAAAKIRLFERLPFTNKVNFTAQQKRIITRRWRVVRYYQSLKPGQVASPKLKQTNAVISRGRLVLNKQKGLRRILRDWYVLDTIRSRREYTIFLSQKELLRIVGADSPMAELREIVLTRKPRGFLLEWAKGHISDDEIRYTWIYGAYPAGTFDEGSFNRYTIKHLKDSRYRQKITAVRLIYHVGGHDG